MTSQELRDRTKKFSVEVVTLCISLNKAVPERLISQLIGSATSVAANYRAACRARSKAEFIAKLHIAVEEADETMFWLEILMEAGIKNDQGIKTLYEEAKQILYILSSSEKTTKENLKK